MAILTLGCVPYKAYVELTSICKTIYRLTISHKHLLEWMTSEEAEKQSKTTFGNYYKMMLSNVILGIMTVVVAVVMFSRLNYRNIHCLSFKLDIFINNYWYFVDNYTLYNV